MLIKDWLDGLLSTVLRPRRRRRGRGRRPSEAARRLAAPVCVLEARMLLSSSTARELAREQDAPSIVFVSSNVVDPQWFLDNLSVGNEHPDSTDAPPEVVLLDGARDGLQQINEVLSRLPPHTVSSVSIVSHGSAGSLDLGEIQLGLTSLFTRGPEFVAWRQALTQDADVLLYGCDVGAGASGRLFVEQLARLTGADVAASNDLTGDARLGGDWDLEVQTGVIETPTFAPHDLMAGSGQILADLTAANGKTVTGTDGADHLRGVDGNETLVGRQGDDLLEGGAGNDTYQFSDGFGTDTVTEASGEETLDFSRVTSASELTVLVSPLEAGKVATVQISATTGRAGQVTLGLTGENGVTLIKGGAGVDTLDLSQLIDSLQIAVKKNGRIVVSHTLNGNVIELLQR